MSDCSDDDREGKKVAAPRMNARMRAQMKLAGGDAPGKRAAEKQLGPGEDDGSEDDDAPKAPQVASAEVMAQRKILKVKVPERFRNAAPVSVTPIAPGTSQGKGLFGNLSSSRPAPAVAPKLQTGGLMAKATPPSPEHVPLQAPASPKPFDLKGGDFSSKPNPFGGVAARTAPAAQAANPFKEVKQFGNKPDAAPGTFNFGTKKEEVAPAAKPSPFSFGAKKAEAPAPAASSEEKPKEVTEPAKKPAPFGFKANLSADANPFAAAKKKIENGEIDKATGPAAKGPEMKTFTAADPTKLVTGEEGEETEVSEQVKLYALCNKEWVDRGAGVLKLNTKTEGGAGCRARLIMRSVATMKALLNAPLNQTFKMVKTADNHFIFASASQGEDGAVETTSFLVKGKNAQAGPEQVKALVSAIEKHIK